jgi:predicted nuclease of predicted toxin-antitoxin system
MKTWPSLSFTRWQRRSLIHSTSGASGTAARQMQLALSSGCTLLTRDEDFLQLSILNGAPPKVILLRTGNCSTAEVVSLLQTRLAVITRFLDDEDATIRAHGG